mgnify:CR=1 FL=1
MVDNIYHNGYYYYILYNDQYKDNIFLFLFPLLLHKSHYLDKYYYMSREYHVLLFGYNRNNILLYT